jgi:hypothetical protein
VFGCPLSFCPPLMASLDLPLPWSQPSSSVTDWMTLWGQSSTGRTRTWYDGVAKMALLPCTALNGS